MDNLPNSNATPYALALGSQPGTSSLVMDNTANPAMPQGVIGYPHPAGYPLGYSALHIGGQGHPGIQLPAVYYQNPHLVYTDSVGNLAMQPVSSGLVHGQLPAHAVYNQPILTHQSSLDGQPFQWTTQHNLSQTAVPGAAHLPPGIVDYQHLLSQGAVLKVATAQAPILPMPATATRQTATTQTTMEIITEETSGKANHEKENGVRSTEENTPSRNESPPPASKESPRPASPEVSYRTQPISVQQNNIILGTKPKKLNPSLQLRSPGSPNSLEGRLFQSRSSFDGSSPSSRRSFTNSTTSPTTMISPVVNSDHVIPCYERPVKRDQCLRCFKKVYPLEQLGPIKEVMYHKNCFTCVACGTQLNLKNFGHNPNDLDDLNVFCIAHRPKERSASVDASSVNIARALNAPKLDKVNEQIRGDRYPSEVLSRSSYGQTAASAFLTPQETIYYGMGDDDQPRQHQLYNQEAETGYRQTQQSSQQQQHAEWINGRYTVVSTVDRAPSFKGTHERQVSSDEVFDFPDSGKLNGRKSPDSSESSESSSTSVPIRRDDRPSSMDTVLSEMTSKMMNFKQDSGDGPMMRSDRPSNSPTPPLGVTRTNSKQEGVHNARISTGSNISRHGSLDLHSSYTPQAWARASTTSLERSDRPSLASSQYHGGRERVELIMPSQSEVVSVSIHVDPSRYLPQNETRRMDRPSQYS